MSTRSLLVVFAVFAFALSSTLASAGTPISSNPTFNGVSLNNVEGKNFTPPNFNPFDDPTDPVDTLWWTGNIDLHIFAGQTVSWHPDLPQLNGVLLQIKYGLWNSPSVPLRLDLNGNTVGTVIANVGYISPGPKYATFNITNYIVAGQDTITISALGGNEAVIGYVAVGIKTANVEGVNSSNSQIHPSDFTLQPPCPNPFNSQTSLTFSLPEAGDITLMIFNLQGREVAILMEGFQSAGEHSIVFNASHLPSGLYWVNLSYNTGCLVQKLLFIK